MAKKGGGDWFGWALLGVFAGAVIYYSKVGQGKENNAVAIPDSLERLIDDAVDTLNRRYGKGWIDVGINVAVSYLRRAMPQAAAVADIIAEVELESRRRPMSGRDKQQAVGRIALNRGITG